MVVLGLFSVELVLYFLCFVILIIASISDFKKHEVADYLSFIFFGLAIFIRIIYSVILNDYFILLDGFVGFVLFFFISLAMYYTGQWGGGDSKILLGLGFAMGINVRSFIESFVMNFAGSSTFVFDLFGLFTQFLTQLFTQKFVMLLYSVGLIRYIVLIFLIGAIYALVWTIVLSLINFKRLIVEIKNNYVSKWFVIIRRIIYLVVVLLLFVSFFVPVYFRLLFYVLSLMIFSFYYVALYLKSVEKSALVKSISVDKLVEGDWIVEEVYIGKEKICGPGELGLELFQIERLRKSKIKSVLVKQGIPFVPSFLIALVIFLVI
jgi:Flp pilus assembly protein protease CpaA